MHACRSSAKELIVGWQGLAAGLAHMHSKGIADHDMHVGNLLLSADDSQWKKANLGNAAWCMLQPDEQAS